MADLSGLASFLNNGQVPPNVTTGSESTSQLPTWYTNYANGILNNVSQYANQGAPIFPGPQVAPQSEDTLGSYQQLRDLAGTYGGLASQGAGIVGNQANNIANGGGLATASPYLNQAQGQVNNVLGGQSPLGAASSYLNESNASAPSVVGNYMNPYNQQVVQNMGNVATQNLQNNLLPALQSAFTSSGGGGHYGGTDPTLAAQGNQGVGNTAQNFAEEELGRNVAQDTAMQQAALLQSGYNTSLGAAQNDLARQGQLGSTAGGLSSAGSNIGLQGAGELGQLGTAAGNLGATNIGQGLSAGSSLANIGAMGANTGLGIAGGMNSAGEQQQQQQQNNLNAAMQNYYQQFNWPLTGANAMESALQGIQTPTLNQAYQSGPMNPSMYTTASPLSQLSSLASNGNIGGALGQLGNLISGLGSSGLSGNALTSALNGLLGGSNSSLYGGSNPAYSGVTSPFALTSAQGNQLSNALGTGGIGNYANTGSAWTPLNSINPDNYNGTTSWDNLGTDAANNAIQDVNFDPNSYQMPDWGFNAAGGEAANNNLEPSAQTYTQPENVDAWSSDGGLGSAGSSGSPFNTLGHDLGLASQGLGVYSGISSGTPVGDASAALGAAHLGAETGLLPSAAGTIAGDLAPGLGLYSGIQQGGPVGDISAAYNAYKLGSLGYNAATGAATAAPSSSAASTGLLSGMALPMAFVMYSLGSLWDAYENDPKMAARDLVTSMQGAAQTNPANAPIANALATAYQQGGPDGVKSFMAQTFNPYMGATPGIAGSGYRPPGHSTVLT